MRPVILPYKLYSNSAKALQNWLKANGYPRLKRSLSPRENRFVINWGNSSVLFETGINKSQQLIISSNKLTAFLKFKEVGVNIPDFTTDVNIANNWIEDGCIVFGRANLKGHSGDGIIIFQGEKISSDKECPLYVKYKKKRKEFRVHVVRSKVIDIQEKRRRQGIQTDSLIRNHHTGWVYCREDITPPHDLIEQAHKAVLALGLDFGAVDLIYNEHENTSYVLEVNSSPGLVGTTLDLYGQAFKEILDENC